MAGMFMVIQHSDSLAFSIENHSKNDHTVEVKVFDENNDMIFNETYLSNSSTGIYSSIGTSTLGSYKYIVTLDNNITKEQNVYVEYSDYLIIGIYDEEYEYSDEVLELSVSAA
ncbi:hypothetical protein [Methanococcoides seepicolus]|uniref:Uncharacterized protein n=1 Tax=Methanococcoides seepicolus TaxID=2828780 RepID=A0A9E4ZHA4_9EURY|nr:hypothetical protein [Methanococcoides seepicolus]MCM1987900.1 hypothetical protein [Methanococcoides seepicolus]